MAATYSLAKGIKLESGSFRFQVSIKGNSEGKRVCSYAPQMDNQQNAISLINSDSAKGKISKECRNALIKD